ncbi:hypothetical protein BJX63DRAFT_384027 [Aspergillus granulosus]|uniref:Secreted protein n=1 Tax=Aspergillus granulosus TaxID=176169 RepID=A0ABR4HSJ8_9EURO
MNFRLIWSLSLLLGVHAAVIPRAEDSSATLIARGDDFESETDRPGWPDWHHGHPHHGDEDGGGGHQIGEGW